MHRSSCIAALALSLGALFSAPTVSASESSILFNPSQLAGQNLCVRPSPSTGLLQAQLCQESASELWQAQIITRDAAGTAFMVLRHRATGQCADIESATALEGAAIVARTCSYSTTQQWSTPSYTASVFPVRIGPSNQPLVPLVNRFNGRCLTRDNDRVVQQICSSSNSAQRWFFAL